MPKPEPKVIEFEENGAGEWVPSKKPGRRRELPPQTPDIPWGKIGSKVAKIAKERGESEIAEAAEDLAAGTMTIEKGIFHLVSFAARVGAHRAADVASKVAGTGVE